MQQPDQVAKPRHLQADYGAQFADRCVVAAYRHRPPYPAAAIDALVELAGGDTGVVLDLGAGTGDITWPLAERVAHIDAIEPSTQMVAAANARPGVARERVQWFASTAEQFDASRSYSLVVAGESMHWMEWTTVLPKIARALVPGGWLAILADRLLCDLPWEKELSSVIARHSTNQDYLPYDIGNELSSRGLFDELNRRTYVEPGFRQRAQDYVESFHSRNGFSRERMDRESCARFDAEVLALTHRHQPEGIVRARVKATLIWGLPCV